MESIIKIYKKFMKGRLKEFKISGSTIANHFISPFLTYCNAFIDDEYRDEETAFMNYLSQRGISHEKNVVESLPGDIILCPEINPKEAFKIGLIEMTKGIQFLFNFPFYNVSKNFIGYIDVVEKINGIGSIFGNFHYRVIEIKSAKNIKEKHILQAAFYNLLLGEIQEYTPNVFYLINSENKKQTYNYSEYKDKVLTIINSITDIFERKYIPQPILDLNGDLYPWSKYSSDLAIKNKDISLISGIGGKKRKLFMDAGFDTLEKVTNSDISKLIEIKGVANKSATKYKKQADVLISSTPIINSTEFFEIKKKEPIRIYLDIENTVQYFAEIEDTIECVYLYGILVEKEMRNIEKSIFVENPENLDERKDKFLEFIKFVNQFDDTKIYHWGHHEKTHLKKEAEKLGIIDKYNQISERLADLSKIFKKSLVLPIYTYSIKEVSKYFGFQWEDKGMDGSATIFMYLTYLQYKDIEIRNILIRYNLDDVKAMSHIVNNNIK